MVTQRKRAELNKLVGRESLHEDGKKDSGQKHLLTPTFKIITLLTYELNKKSNEKNEIRVCREGREVQKRKKKRERET